LLIFGLAVAAEPAVDDGFVKLMSEIFYGNKVFSWSRVFSFAVTCAPVVL
jgi:hypothetical protein